MARRTAFEQDLRDTIAAAPELPAPAVGEVYPVPGRRFRSDVGYPALKIAIEAEGGTWFARGGPQVSRHTSGAGYANDCRKYNLMAIHGWLIIRLTRDMLRYAPDDALVLGICEACEALRFIRAALIARAGSLANARALVAAAATPPPPPGRAPAKRASPGRARRAQRQ